MNEEILRRWRLVLGKTENEINLTEERDISIDNALNSLYSKNKKGAGLGKSSPAIGQWLQDIRNIFPSSTVKLLQKDAIERFDNKRFLFEKEILENLQPDVHLAAELISLSSLVPDKSKEIARDIVKKVTDDLVNRLSGELFASVEKSLKSSSNRKKSSINIDLNYTIKHNLKNYRPELKTIIPDNIIGHDKKSKKLRDVILCLDQSASMADSIVYSGIYGSVLSSIPSLRTRVIVFDTSVVDLTDLIKDPVELLFSVRLGGGTDIARALTYCKQNITSPENTIFILVSDLYEGGNEKEMKNISMKMAESGVKMIVLLALNDTGAPSYHKENAEFFASLKVPVFACTPDHFPEVISKAIEKKEQ